MKYNQSAAVIALLCSSVDAFWQRTPYQVESDYERFQGAPIGSLAQSPEDYIVKPKEALPRK